MGHIDYDAVSTLDALVDISDAGARAVLIRLRELLAERCPDLEERLVADGRHRKPTIALYQGDDSVLHVYPEPGGGVGLHVELPLRQAEMAMLDTRRFSPWLRERLEHARTTHNMLWVDAILHSPGRADELVPLIERRVDLLPRAH